MVAKSQILNKKLISYLLDPSEQMTESGVYLTLSNIFLCKGKVSLGFDESFQKLAKLTELVFDSTFRVDLKPGFYIVKFNERLSLPKDIISIIYGSELLLKTGNSLNSYLIHSGCSGEIFALLNVSNAYGLELYKHAKIAYCVFEEVDDNSKTLSTKICNSIKNNYQG